MTHFRFWCIKITRVCTKAEFSFTFIFISTARHDEKDIEMAACLLMHKLKINLSDSATVNHVFVAMAGLIRISG